MKIVVIQSGSKGNATLVIHNGRVLLIDMGITLCSLKEALEKENKNLMNIEAMLLTHEHSDHTKGIKYLDPLPIYCGKRTYDSENVVNIKYFDKFDVGLFHITALKTSHDASKPMGFLITAGDETLAYITDTGYIPEKTLKLINNADYYVVESNHDIEMLINSKRPQCLKERILSNKGHLCNEDSAMYLAQVTGSKTKEIILAHLSEECNEPTLAINAYEKIFERFGVSLKNVKIHCASQHKITYGGTIK